MHEFTYPDSRSTFVDHFRWALSEDTTALTFRGVVSWIDDVHIHVQKPDPTNLNMGLVDFTPARWTRFIAQYINRDHFTSFINRLPKLKPQQTAGYSAPVLAPHNLGNCFIGLTARHRRKNQAHLTLYSRTTIWAPTGILDLYTASLVADWWSKQIQQPVILEWVLTQQQFTTWKSLAFLVNMMHMEAKITGNGIHDTWWGKQLTGTEPTNNSYLRQMRKVYDMSRNIHLHMERSYALMTRQTNRMLSAERRFLAGQQRDLRPPIDTLTNPQAEYFWATKAGVDSKMEEEDEELEEVLD